MNTFKENQMEIAGGSVRGRNHLLSGKNNQDAFGWGRAGENLAAVVCDGCSSGEHSEVGAQLGVRWMVRRMLQSPTSCPLEIMEKVTRDLRELLNGMGGDRRQVIHDYFLFTVVGVILTARSACVFSMGDGMIGINEDLRPIESDPPNQPQYPAYRILGGQSEPQTLFFGESSAVRNILIGTDGVADLRSLENRFIPGKSEPVGPLGQFWKEDYYFANQDGIRRRLALLNRETVRWDQPRASLERHSGLLPDDTTLIVIRRSC